MNESFCPRCGAPVEPGASVCKSCGQPFTQQPGQQQYAQQQPGQPYAQQQPGPQYAQQQPGPQYVQQQPVYYVDPTWPVRSKVAAGVLGILLGDLGIHKFYLGKIGLGILYLCFCWTGIPGVIGLIEGILYLCSNDAEFQMKNHVRIS